MDLSTGYTLQEGTENMRERLKKLLVTAIIIAMILPDCTQLAYAATLIEV